MTQVTIFHKLNEGPWIVPADWTSVNEIIAFGAGSGGCSDTIYNANASGSGGEYRKIVNQFYTPFKTITCSVGAGGAGGQRGGPEYNGSPGGDTYLLDDTNSSVVLQAKGALAPSGTTPGLEGLGGVGLYHQNGGRGYSPASVYAGASGGGAGGPNGAGGWAPQPLLVGTGGGTGGGGADGGTTSGDGAPAQDDGFQGGTGTGISAGGLGGVYPGDGFPGVDGADGVDGSGGGGGSRSSIGPTGNGGRGGPGIGWTSTETSEVAGPGGGGGASGSDTVITDSGKGGDGGLYGGGGASCGSSNPGASGEGGAGADGILIFVYTAAEPGTFITSNPFKQQNQVLPSM